MLVYLTCSSLFINRIKCPNTFYPAARGVNRGFCDGSESFRAHETRQLHLTDKDVLTGYSGHILLFLFLCHVYFPTMAFKPWTFSPRWSCHPPPQRPNPVLCQAVTFTVESTGTDSLLELQLLQLFALCCGGASYCCRLSVLVEGFGIGF